MNFLKNKGIKFKILSLVGFALVVFGGLAGYSNYMLKSLETEVKVLGSERLPISDLIGDMKSAINAIPRFMWLSLELPLNSPERASAIEKSVKNIDVMKAALTMLESVKLNEVNAARLKELAELMPKLMVAIEHAKVSLDKNTVEANALARETLLKEMPPVAVKMTSVVVDFSETAKKLNEKVVAEAQAASTMAQTLILLISTSLAFVLVGVGYIISTAMTKELIGLTESVGAATDQVAGASNELSTSADRQSASAQEQASAIQEASASLTEIAGMVEANVKGAEAASSAAKKVQEISAETEGSMSELSKSMAQILESNSKIEKLVKIIEEIGEKTEVIDDIVFKTQLLSFNASVEAERAGEHGRGFAVVAQEVGNLAQMSGKAATEISNILKSSIAEAWNVTTENKNQVQEGALLADETRSKMSRVLQELGEISESTSKIVAASKEQSQGISQITASIDALNHVTQETASAAEESATASAELNGQTESLENLVGDLRKIVLGTDLKTVTSEDAKPHSSEVPKGKVVPFHKKSPKGPKHSANKKVVGQSFSPHASESGDAWEKL